MKGSLNLGRCCCCCRFVIPLLPREVTGNLDDLGLHSVGVLEVG
jgi:hypothetical protein